MQSAQLLLVPGGTSPLAVTRTFSAVHKLWEFHERFEKTGMARTQRILVAPRPADECTPSNLTAANAHLQERLRHLPETVDVIVETSGSSTGSPRLVGLSMRALVASARATHAFLGGPGRWIVALPVHHIAGLQTLVRACVAATAPVIADMSGGFDANALLTACRTATDTSNWKFTTRPRAYLSLVQRQLQLALEAGGDLVAALGTLDAILVGGSALDEDVLERARAAGLSIVTTYGMTETGGGCVYDGQPLAGVEVRIGDDERIQIGGPILMEGYLDAGPGAVTMEAGKTWLKTADRGRLEDGKLEVLGRVDTVIVSGAVNVSPQQVTEAACANGLVKQAHTVGLADPQWGEVVAMLVVSDQPATVVGPKLREEVAQAVPRAWAPRVVACADELPLTAMSKVDTAKVRTILLQALAEGRAWKY